MDRRRKEGTFTLLSFQVAVDQKEIVKRLCSQIHIPWTMTAVTVRKSIIYFHVRDRFDVVSHLLSSEVEL